jgi:tRNA U55 pseudouridine synthase TruB
VGVLSVVLTRLCTGSNEKKKPIDRTTYRIPMRPIPRIIDQILRNSSTRNFHYNRKMTPVPLEGMMAINKPTGISSAEVLRKLQKVFNPSDIFAETLFAERKRRKEESRNQKNLRRKTSARNVQVKIGHGGTLDPMASGVLIAGIGRATKKLQQFLTCSKTYEATMVFGAETDSFDAMGKVVGYAQWDGVTREMVLEKLQRFRGDILQIPPMFVAFFFFFSFSYFFEAEIGGCDCLTGAE